MKNKRPVSILTLIVCLVVLFIPTYIAIGAFIAGPNEEYRNASKEITSMTVVDIKGNEYTYQKGNGDNMISIFKGMLDSSAKVSALSDAIRATPAYSIKTVSKNGESSYRFYFSTTSASYYEDSHGNAYGITRENCAEFFRSECAVCLFYNTSAPILRNAYNDVITPQTMIWKYLDYDKSFAVAPVTTTSEEKTYELDGAFTLTFDIEPSYAKAVLYSNDVVIYDGALAELSSSVSVSSSTVYKLVIEAKWHEDAGKEYCGEAKYTFISNVEAQASFTLGENKVEAGQIAVINGINIKDPSLINVSITPALKYNGKDIPVSFYGKDGAYSALLAIPASCFTDNAENGSVMQYTIDITYGAAKYSLHLDVSDRSVKTSDGNATLESINEKRSEAALDTFKQLLEQTAAKTADTKLWTENTFYSYGDDGEYRFALSFGRKWNLAGNLKYTNEFVQYIMSDGTSIIAVNDGKVVAVGENDYLGKYVAIDHGMGLQTWYCHLSSISVSVGDNVTNEQKIAKSGSTGFIENSNIGFAIMYTVNGVPVCPYSQTSGKGLEETGLNMTAFN